MGSTYSEKWKPAQRHLPSFQRMTPPCLGRILGIKYLRFSVRPRALGTPVVCDLPTPIDNGWLHYVKKMGIYFLTVKCHPRRYS